MGGYGSGRYGGRPLVEHSRRIDLPWMFRKGLAREGRDISGTLEWTCNGQPSGSIGYRANMFEPGAERLLLSYRRTRNDESEDVEQTIHLTHTVPHFGGKRWWMQCPYRRVRCAKLYLPPRGDRFASMAAWRLGYQCQRDAHRDRPFEKLFRLQKKLGCPQGWESGIRRPKGMWRRTFERYDERHWELYEECNETMDLHLIKAAARLMRMTGDL